MCADNGTLDTYVNPFDAERDAESTEWVATQLRLMEEAGDFPERDGRWDRDDDGNMIYSPSEGEIREICAIVRSLHRQRADGRRRIPNAA